MGATRPGSGKPDSRGVAVPGVRIAVTGSIATDRLMAFPGRFADHLLTDALDRISLSFLVDDPQIRRGGTAANIALGLGRLGLRPYLVGAVGTDFGDYRGWLEAHGVDTELVHVSRTRPTAHFVCTTDADQNQIGSFCAGALAEAAGIDLRAAAERAGGFDAVLVSPNDPRAMVRHTDDSRALGIPFFADPSQQLARMTGPDVRGLVDGASLLFVNEYEAGLLRERTGWSEPEVLRRVGTWVVTRGAHGVSILTRGARPVEVPAVPAETIADPTGVGDAFRAGFLAGLARGLSHHRAAQLGCAVATVVLESAGSQEYKLVASDLLARLDRAYGRTAALELEPLLAGAL